MAAESLITNNDTRVGEECKIYKIGNFLVGAAGDASLCEDFRKWFTEEIIKKGCIERFPNPNNCRIDDQRGFSAFVVDSKKRIWKYEDICVRRQYEASFIALGSGAHFAMGAMEAGKSAVESVKIACKFDIFSGGRIKLINL